MALSLPVAAISDTAFLTALYRAIESDRPDAHFHDPYARILAGVRGEKVLRQIPNGAVNALGCAVRTCVMDELIMQVIQQEKVDTVLNLGAGLDARPYRLSLPSSLCWIEADFPDVLAYKAKKLAHGQPSCQLKAISLDVEDEATRKRFLQTSMARANRVLVITEGVLIYMHPPQVAALAHDLSTYAPIGWWLTDLASPTGLQLIQQSLGEIPTHHEANLQFAPAEGTTFFAQQGWKTSECRFFIEEAQRLQRGALSDQVVAQFSQEQWQVLCQMASFILLSRK